MENAAKQMIFPVSQKSMLSGLSPMGQLVALMAYGPNIWKILQAALHAGKGGPTLLAALTAFVNLVLTGGTPPSIRPFFFGATLTALEKKGGGIRPIAVGCTLRRLVAKVASASVREAMVELLAPHQLGFGVKKGAEAAVHAARLYLHNLSSDKALYWSLISEMLSILCVGTSYC